jgi:hypothetical protein
MGPENKYTTYEKVAIMQTLMARSQKLIVKFLVERFFSDILDIFKTKLRDERDAMFFYLSPDHFVSQEIIDKFHDLIERNNKY